MEDLNREEFSCRSRNDTRCGVEGETLRKCFLESVGIGSVVTVERVSGNRLITLKVDRGDCRSTHNMVQYTCRGY